MAIVEPGVFTADLKAAARANKLFYPPDPASMKDCTIGGNVATNAGGPRCLKYGVTRNYVIGLEVVLTNGEVLQTGGRVHKNKTGFDLIGLFCWFGRNARRGHGNHVAFAPTTSGARHLAPGLRPTPAKAAEAVQAIFTAGFLPSSLEIADHFTLEAAPALISGRGSFRRETLTRWSISTVRRKAFAAKPQPFANCLKQEKQMPSKRRSVNQPAKGFGALRRQFSNSLRATGLTKLNEDVVVPRSHLVDLMEFAEKLQTKHGFPIACFGHAGDGNIHVNIMVDRYNRMLPCEKKSIARSMTFSSRCWHGVA